MATLSESLDQLALENLHFYLVYLGNSNDLMAQFIGTARTRVYQ